MKKLRILIIFLSLAIMAIACKDENDPVSEENIQLEKLSSTWVATEVTKDEIGDGGYDNFRLILSGNPESQVFTYAVIGRPEMSPWLAGGTWRFGSQVASQIVRDPGTVDEVQITYTLSETTLTLEFDFTGEGYPNGRTESLEGTYRFTLQKQ